MNHPALLFRDLTSAWQQDAASERVEVLAAELAASVAAFAGSTCLGLIRPEAVPKFFGLVYFLDGYGLVLRKRYRTHADAVFVYLDKKTPAIPQEHCGVVTEVAAPEREAEVLAHAA